MEIREKIGERTLLLSFSGEMDHHGVRDTLRRIDLAVDVALPQTLTLDFSGVTFMDSSGIALILRSQRKMRILEGNMILRNVPQQARRVLEAAGINRLVKIQTE
ncbi:MAG: anti-sigma factor antagonist [Oscillospiraceae bacterium]|nr:anti-sigma factor antagonist [Oscillospiraceae bacterium]